MFFTRISISEKLGVKVEEEHLFYVNKKGKEIDLIIFIEYFWWLSEVNEILECKKINVNFLSFLIFLSLLRGGRVEISPSKCNYIGYF